MTGAGDDLLGTALAAAVPLWIVRVRSWTPERRRQAAVESGEFVAAHGDDILFRGGKRGASAAAFNHLARGLAVLAFAPGGVTFGGSHWCTDHGACQAASPISRDASASA